jgi:hypothetical protein
MRRVALVLLALVVLVVVIGVLTNGGGGPPDDGDIREAESDAPNTVYWAGRRVAGLPLAAMNTDGPWITFVYGDCRPDRDEDCSPPLTIQTVSVCDLNPIEFAGLPRASRRRDRFLVREYGEGRRMVNIGASTVIMYARGSTLRDRALQALRPVGEAAPKRPPRARYPRAFVAEVRRVHDAYRRLGAIRRVRAELRISQKAIRFRLALAEELGPRRLRQPASAFAPSVKDVAVIEPVDVQSSCEVEPF